MKSKKNIQNIKNKTKQTQKMSKTDCVLGYIDKNGLGKINSNDYKNDFNCLIFGHKPCLLRMDYQLKNIPKSIKLILKKLNTKKYKDVIYIYPRFKKTAILCNEIANNYNFFKSSLELEGQTKLSKRNYILGFLLGYRDNEIRGFFLRQIALNKIQYPKRLKSENDFTMLDKQVTEEITKFKKNHITKFNRDYKEVKTICNTWLKLALGKNSIYIELYKKAQMDIKLLEV